MSSRIGFGKDSHKLVKGNSISLGCIEFPSKYKIDSWSDGDVIAHALTDAILGSIANKNIGFYFPDSDSKNKDRKSIDFLSFAINELHKQKYTINNIDIIVTSNQIMISDYDDKIRESLSRILKIDINQISLKGKRNYLKTKYIIAEVVMLVSKGI